MSDTRRPLLIVEDDPALQKQMQWAFDKYETIVAADREAAIAQLRRYEPAVVTMDLGLPPHPDDPTEGLQLLEEIHTLSPDTKVIVLTGQSDHGHALRAIALGAHDFCTKPFEPEILTWTIDRAFRVHELQEENRRLQASQQAPAMSGIITRDPAMQRTCRTVEKVAPTSATVLILGESGTGKELFARAVHDLSPRRDKRFVAINCAAIPETLLESELFGYEKGAYTGAARQTIGKFEAANGGTLFLDEIGDLPVALQAKLLRFLQERVIERVEGVRKFRSTCGSSARPTRISRTRSQRAAFARTSTIGSPRSSSTFHRCGNARGMQRCSRMLSYGDSAPNNASAKKRCCPMHWLRSTAIRGPAMCASSRT